MRKHVSARTLTNRLHKQTRPENWRPKRGEQFNAYLLLPSGERHYHPCCPFTCTKVNETGDVVVEAKGWKFTRQWDFEPVKDAGK
jgi:hypothetical protein